MKKFIGVMIILLTLLLTVIYRQLAGSRIKDKPGHTYVPGPGVIAAPPGLTKGHRRTLARLREELPLFQLLIQ